MSRKSWMEEKPIYYLVEGMNGKADANHNKTADDSRFPNRGETVRGEGLINVVCGS